MSADAIFEILPPGGLDQSILLAVLVGMLLLLFLTEAFGWVFVGLVVPGYLSSVAIIQPSSAFAVIFESIITYLIARSVSELMSRSRSWSPFFGRERFLLIVLVSIFVRQNSQIWMLPATLRWIDSSFGTSWYTDLDFYSIGLVLIPLTANMFWKLGLVRGSLQVAVPTVLTYAVLQLVLLPRTNLSFANLALTYENVALDFLGSPKAYMILLVGAFLAAQANLRYGWDYSGVLVPSLLALAWFTPLTVAVTLGEAVVLYLITRLVLMLPGVRTLNLEGPRKVSLIFILGFSIKYLGGWGLYRWFPDLRVTDFFGFGYVLTSLLAVKMLTKRVIGRIVWPTALISALAFVVGSLVGYALEQIAPAEKPRVSSVERDSVETRMLVREPLGIMALAEVRARSVLPAGMRDGRSGTQLRAYAALWRRIDSWLAGNGEVSEIASMAGELGLVFRRLEHSTYGDRPTYALYEREEFLAHQTGWDTAILMPGAPGPYIEVPRPADEWPVAQAAAVLCEQLGCRGVLVSGSDSDDSSAANALTHPRASFQIAHRQLARTATIQLRSDASQPAGSPVLHLQHALPEAIELDNLWPGQLSLLWEPPPTQVQQWRSGRETAILRVHPDDLHQRLLATAPPLAAARPQMDLQGLVAPIVEDSEAPGGQALDPQRWEVVLPSESELLFLERMLAEPMLKTAPQGAAGHERMRWLQRMAALVDHQIVALADCVGVDLGCWVLVPEADPTRFPLGVLAVRVGDAKPLAVEIPRPQRERGTFRIGVEIWRDAGARALLINPDEKLLGPGMRLDPTMIRNPVTPFQAVHQALHHSLVNSDERAGVGDVGASSSGSPALLREPVPDATVGLEAPHQALIVQVRGFSGWRAITEDLIIGMGPPVMQSWQIPPLLEEIIAPSGPLGWLSDSMRFADGSEELISLAGQGTPQISYSRSLGDVEMALLWLSELARERYRPASRERYQEQFRQVGLELVDRSLAAAVAMPAFGPSRRALSGRAEIEFAELVARARRYALIRDIHLLRALEREARVNPAVEIEALWSHELGRPFLHIEFTAGDELRRALIGLNTRAGAEQVGCEREPHISPRPAPGQVTGLIHRCGFVIVAAAKTRP